MDQQHSLAPLPKCITITSVKTGIIVKKHNHRAAFEFINKMTRAGIWGDYAMSRHGTAGKTVVYQVRKEGTTRIGTWTGSAY